MLWDNLRPEVRQRLSPYREVIDNAARRNGVDPNVLYATIASESSGRANAVGDGGRAAGLWQVQRPYTRDWGMTDPAQRFDPVASTNAIVPVIGKILRRRGGDWGLMTAQYMRGPEHANRLQAGEAPEKVFAGDPVGLARYNQAKRLQGKYGGSVNPTPAPAPAPVPAAQPAAAPAPLPWIAPPATGSGGGFVPLPAATVPARLPGMGAAPHAPRRDDGVDDVMRMFGLDRLV